MKKALTVPVLFSLVVLLSCGGNGTNNTIEPKEETPSALQEDHLEIKRYARSGDLDESLYEELVDKDPALKKLENDLNTSFTKRSEVTRKFNDYDSKSNSYYSSVDHKLAAIADSLLKRRVASLIANSSTQYRNTTAELQSLLKQISQNNTSLNDHHSVLKIVLTIPLIEKYQKNNLPGKTEFIDFRKRQENLLKRIDTLTPNY